jgi:hypothetical protein
MRRPLGRGGARAASATCSARSVALLLLTSPAVSTADPELAYQAPDDCPSVADFRRQLAMRRRDEGRIEAAALRVRIVAKGGGFAGSIEISAADPVSREIEGVECDEVVSALAVIAALALDQAAAEMVDGSDDVARAGAGSPRLAPPLETPTGAWISNLGAGLAAVSGPSPGVLVAAVLAAEVEHAGAEPLAPSFVVESLAAEQGLIGPDGEDARFRWLALRFGVCPLRVGQPLGVWFRPCAAADLGVVRAEGRNLPRTYVHTVPWLAIGALPRAGWASSNWYVTATAGALGIITQDDFVVRRPDRRVHRVPALEFTGQLAAGLRF